MNRRQAKLYAYRACARVLEGALGEGWPHNDMATQLGDETAESNADRVAQGVREIIHGLYLRSGTQKFARRDRT